MDSQRCSRLTPRALKPGAPFVFTYHHNDPAAYAPVGISRSRRGELSCEAVLPAPGEMEASLHIHGTGSSVLDSVFVCRMGEDLTGPEEDRATRLRIEPDGEAFERGLLADLRGVARGGVKVVPWVTRAACSPAKWHA